MENASKALIMAAGILIGMMILSLGVYLFSTFGNSASQVQEEVRKNQIAEFNSQFLKFDGRDVTIYDILTMANLAKNNNEGYGLTTAMREREDSYYISVKLKNNYIENDANKYMSNAGNITLNEAETITNDEGKEEVRLKTYKCKVVISPKTERVYKVELQ